MIAVNKKFSPLILPVIAFFAKAMGAFFKLPLTAIIGAEGVGLFSSIFPLYALAVALVTSGVKEGLSVAVAKSNSFGKSSLIYFLRLSLLISTSVAVLFVLASTLVYPSLNKATTLLLCSILCPSVILSSVSAVLKGFLYGKQVSLAPSLSLAIEQVAKCILGLSLALIFGNTPTRGAICAFVGVTLSDALSFLYLLSCLKGQRLTAGSIEKGAIKLIIPLHLSGLISPTVTLAESAVVIKILTNLLGSTAATSAYGILSGVVTPIFSLPNALFSSLIPYFLPRIASSGNRLKQRDGISGLLSIALSCGLFFVAALFFFGERALTLLYPTLQAQQLNLAIHLLLSASLLPLVTIITSATWTAFSALSRPKLPLIVSSILGALRIVCSALLLPRLSINAIIISETLYYALFAIIALTALLVQTKPTVCPAFIPRILLCTATFSASAMVTTSLLPLNLLFSLLSAGLSTIVFFATAILSGLIQAPKAKPTLPTQ